MDGRIDGCNLAGGQHHAACMRRDADACCMHETRCCVWSRALAIRPVARHMCLLSFCRARRTRARDWQNIHGRIQLTLPTGYYVLDSDQIDGSIDDWHCWHAALQGRAGLWSVLASLVVVLWHDGWMVPCRCCVARATPS